MDFNNPTLTTNYTDFLTDLKTRDTVIASLFKGTHTNVPTDAVKFDDTTKRFSRWNGSTWTDLEIDGAKLVAASVATAAIAANAVDDTIARLRNNNYFRARNAANSGDLSLVKADASDNTWINTPTSKSITFAVNNVAQLAIGSTGSLLPNVDDTSNLGSASFRFATAFATSVQTGFLQSPSGTALTVRTLGAQGITIKTNDANRWQILSTGNVEPETNETYNVGTTTKRINELHTKYLNPTDGALYIGNGAANSFMIGNLFANVNMGPQLGAATSAFASCYAEIMSAPDSYDLRLRAPSTKGILFQPNAGGTLWSINSSGHFYPAADNTYRIGTSGQQCSWVYTTALNSSGRDLTYDALGATTYKHQFRVDANNVFAVGHTGSYGRVNFQNHQTAATAGSLWNYVIIQVDGTNYKIPVYNT